MKSFTVFLVLGLAVAIKSQTKTMKCKGFRQLKADEVSVSNCRDGICKLKKGTDATITLKFKPQADIENLTTSVQAKIAGFQLPFLGVDGVSACSKIHDEAGNVGCPLQSGRTYVYENSFEVMKFYPSTPLLVHWALTSDGEDVTCFEVKARIS